MKILVTGVAGFIGFHVAKALLYLGNEIVGVDNFTPYYELSLKKERLAHLQKEPGFNFIRADLADQEKVFKISYEDPANFSFSSPSWRALLAKQSLFLCLF